MRFIIRAKRRSFVDGPPGWVGMSRGPYFEVKSYKLKVKKRHKFCCVAARRSFDRK